MGHYISSGDYEKKGCTYTAASIRINAANAQARRLVQRRLAARPIAWHRIYSSRNLCRIRHRELEGRLEATCPEGNPEHVLYAMDTHGDVFCAPV